MSQDAKYNIYLYIKYNKYLALLSKNILFRLSDSTFFRLENFIFTKKTKKKIDSSKRYKNPKQSILAYLDPSPN